MYEILWFFAPPADEAISSSRTKKKVKNELNEGERNENVFNWNGTMFFKKEAKKIFIFFSSFFSVSPLFCLKTPFKKFVCSSEKFKISWKYEFCIYPFSVSSVLFKRRAGKRNEALFFAPRDFLLKTVFFVWSACFEIKTPLKFSSLPGYGPA